MNKTIISVLASALLCQVGFAETLTLYSDPKTGQVYTTAGEGRIILGDFIDAKTVDTALREQESKLSEYQEKQSKYVHVKSKAKTLEFSGTHYFGYTYANPDATTTYAANSGGFDLRRNYIGVKGYFNDTDYWRVTVDSTKELASTTSFANVYVKYAYLYLDKILPYTGVEIGIAHRPWIDYEEHSGWMYRSFNKVAIEEKGTATESGVDLVNSADLGVNFKTKTESFSSEIGLYNGEGYHADKGGANQKNDSKLSLEWRLTGHLIGSGTNVGKVDRTKESYAHISTFGLISKNHKDDNASLGQDTTSSDPLKAEYDRSFYGIHAVYNQPAFLIAAQYIRAKDEVRNLEDLTGSVKNKEQDYDIWSINTEIRPFQDWTLIGRYDDYKIERENTSGAKSVYKDGQKIIAGIAYKYNKNVSFIGSSKWIDEKGDTGTDTGESKNVYMLTTEVNW